MASNRDEVLSRPTRRPQFWIEEAPHVFAPRDEFAGGSWLGLSSLNSRWALLTNVREMNSNKRKIKSRGLLVSDFLHKGIVPDYDDRNLYDGFNLIIGTEKECPKYYTNRANLNWNEPVAPGFHVLSNGSLDDPWPKAIRGLERFRSVVEEVQQDNLFIDNKDNDAHFAHDLFQKVLSDTVQCARATGSGCSDDIEDAFSYICVPLTDLLTRDRNEIYGTRSQTVLLIRRDTGKALFFYRDLLCGQQEDVVVASENTQYPPPDSLDDNVYQTKWSEISCTELYNFLS